MTLSSSLRDASPSLLSARRPSWRQHGPEEQLEDDEGNFRRSLQIDMKGLVGDAVGNMSISPGSRDVVLAARRGLFIIDLESPLEVPRFLPQGGTWDVADVQWNPHRSRAEYIVSTSSEKLLIWNLNLVGKTSIEHVLHRHYRAITDINWHTTEPDTVVSTGIDSWIWAWDLREPRKPTFGLSAFTIGGTQVKWNRQDPHMLASSHMNKVLIWDRRKGSLPVSTIDAHASKIYGIDWAHNRRTELVTCSLDKTIKVWEVHESASPKMTIKTTYPVWRARDLPFGCGVLSLPQRGETALEMWDTHEQSRTPVEIFEGHADVVKEFVWRKGGQDGTEFQLITWSKDRTLRFWPVDSDITERVGYVPTPITTTRPPLENDNRGRRSFRNRPKGSDYPAALLSAPVGNRSILAEVRAPLPPRPPVQPANMVSQPHRGSAARDIGLGRPPQMPDSRSYLAAVSASVPNPVSTPRRSGTMSRGNMGGKSARVDALSWLSNVKVGDRRDGSSGAGSGADSADGIDGASKSRASSIGPGGKDGERPRRRSDSRSRGVGQEVEGQSLQDEITSVLTKLAASKIKLEKHDLTKKRTCTLGLHGPWGESSSVFMRITFTFPRDYPQASYPGGTPTVDLERNPLISMKNRALILRRLRGIRERRRPCLEACLRFLLFAGEDYDGRNAGAGVGVGADDLSSSDEEAEGNTEVREKKDSARRSRDLTVALLRNNKNLAEPRTSQGVFGPNGELVCFFRAPPRIVRNVMRDISGSPTKVPQSEPAVEAVPVPAPRPYQSPALVSDAVRRMSLAATDRMVKAVDSRHPDEGERILRIMTNLLTFSNVRERRGSASVPRSEPSSQAKGSGKGNARESYALIPRRSTVFINSTSGIAGTMDGDRSVAASYLFAGKSLAWVCEWNAGVARRCGRVDHERAFKILATLVSAPLNENRVEKRRRPKWRLMSTCDGSLMREIVMRLHTEYVANRDVQMAAMLSVLLLQACRSTRASPAASGDLASPHPDGHSTTPKALDYFSLARRKDTAPSSPTPQAANWPRLSTPPTAPALSSSSSSRGSWSSLFNTGSMRQFMSGVQETLKDGYTPPVSTAGTPIPVPGSERQMLPAESPLRRGRKAEGVAASQSWSDTKTRGSPWSGPGGKASLVFNSAGHRRLSHAQAPHARLRVVATSNEKIASANQKRVLVVEEPEERPAPPLFGIQMMEQFVCHVLAYAEVLYRWGLLQRRAEMLAAVQDDLQVLAPGFVARISKESEIGIIPDCTQCTESHAPGARTGAGTGSAYASTSLQCSFCRLPIQGLARTCALCMHCVHIKCWRILAPTARECPAGCGCSCGV